MRSTDMRWTSRCMRTTVLRSRIMKMHSWGNRERSWKPSFTGLDDSYMRGGVNKSVIVNHQNQGGKKVLGPGDSYEQVTVPYLALGVSEVRTLVLREYDGSLREYIDSHDIDAVIVAYASFMIGAHDYESSANYAMFGFY